MAQTLQERSWQTSSSGEFSSSLRKAQPGEIWILHSKAILVQWENLASKSWPNQRLLAWSSLSPLLGAVSLHNTRHGLWGKESKETVPVGFSPPLHPGGRWDLKGKEWGELRCAVSFLQPFGLHFIFWRLWDLRVLELWTWIPEVYQATQHFLKPSLFHGPRSKTLFYFLLI